MQMVLLLCLETEPAREVAEVARRVEKSEAGIREMIAGGATIAEAREKLGYHTL